MVCVQNFRGLLNCRVSLNTVYANSKIRRPLCLTVFFLFLEVVTCENVKSRSLSVSDIIIQTRLGVDRQGQA